MKYPTRMTLRPLTGWPAEFTRSRRHSQFKASFGDTIGLLDRELAMMNGGYYPQSVLQIALREQDFRKIDGMPRANSYPEHPGVILNIEPSNKPPLSFPCDTFLHWHDNLRAITLTLEALRKIDRYGVTQTGQQYRGWQAIEAAPSVDARAAAASLLARVALPDLDPIAQGECATQIGHDPERSRAIHREARRNAHPDRNDGDQSLWDQVQAAATVLGITR